MLVFLICRCVSMRNHVLGFVFIFDTSYQSESNFHI